MEEYARRPHIPGTTIFTIGYQRLSLPALIHVLSEHGVRRVIDVRYTPYSRKPGFSAHILAKSLGDAGIRYEHWKALGNPPEVRNLYKAGHVEEGRRRFAARLRNGASDAIDQLIELAEAEPLAILCLEGNHAECHRDVVAEEAIRRSGHCLSVNHL